MLGVALLLLLYKEVQRTLFAAQISLPISGTHIFDSVLTAIHLPILAWGVGGLLATSEPNGRSVATPFYLYLLWFLIEGGLRIVGESVIGRVPTWQDFALSPLRPWNHFATLYGIAVLALSFRWGSSRGRWGRALIIGCSAGLFLAQRVVKEFPVLGPVAPLAVFFWLGALFPVSLKKLASVPVALSTIGLFGVAQWAFHGPMGREMYETGPLTLLLSFLGIPTLLAFAFLLRSAWQKLTLLGRDVLFLLACQTLFTGGVRIGLKAAGWQEPWSHHGVGLALGIVGPLILLKLSRHRALIWLRQPHWWTWARRRVSVLDKIVSSSALRLVAGMAVATVLVGLWGVFAGAQAQVMKTVRSARPESAVTVSTEAADITEGERLARIYGCMTGCHAEKMQGGMKFPEEGFGAYVSPNLTQAFHTYSAAELERVVRRGVRPDGTRVLGGMPSSQFSLLTDEEVTAIFSYISSAPVHPSTAPDTEISWEGRFRLALGKHQTEYEKVQAMPDAETLDEGERIARAACAECHGADLQGSPKIPTPPLAVVAAYSKNEFRTLLKTGTALGGRELGLMKMVAELRYSNFTDEEIEALYAYLGNPQ